MKVLILGATGMLGYQLFKTCLNRGIDVHGVVRNSKLLSARLGLNIEDKISLIDDVKNISSVEAVIKAFRPEFVVNCIGIIKQSSLAENYYESISVNSLLPHQLERLGHVYNYQLIQISTDCIFNGNKGMYNKTDLSDAYDLYGKSKYLGEVNYGCGITIRTSIIGHELNEKKHGLIDWFLSQSECIRGYTKAIFSGVTTLELTKIILDVIFPMKTPIGLIQVAAAPINKMDLLTIAAKVYEKKIDIIPSDELVIDRSLDGSSFTKLTGYSSPSWAQMIREMHQDYLENFCDKQNLNSKI